MDFASISQDIKDSNKKMTMSTLINILNKMIKLCEPIKYKDFNKILIAKNAGKLRKYEREYPVVGLARSKEDDEGISTLSIIATITDILIEERLAFDINDNGFIIGVKWYKK